MKFFHVMPTFLTDSAFIDGMQIKSVRLTLETQDGDVCLVPSSKIKATKAFPNKRYYVGGCTETKHGWFIDIPDDLRELYVRLRWEFDMVSGSVQLTKRIHHDICCELLVGDKDGYSMDSMSWTIDTGVAPVHSKANSVGSKKSISDYRRDNSIESYETGRGVITIKEKIAVSSCNKKDIYWFWSRD
jgi:hypothetical protein